MAINSTHPTYAEFILDWSTMRDTYRGERVIKQNGTIYLPATMGMEEDGMKTGQEGKTAQTKCIRKNSPCFAPLVTCVHPI